MGTYKCVLENNVAASTSEDIVQVSVLCKYFEINEYDFKIQNHIYMSIVILFASTNFIQNEKCSKTNLNLF